MTNTEAVTAMGEQILKQIHHYRLRQSIGSCSVIMEAWDSGIHNDPDFLKVQPTNPPNERQLTL